MTNHILTLSHSLSLSLSLSYAGVINVLTTTPLWVVNTRLKMKGIGSVAEKNNNDYNTLYGR